jgi:hypothetical protein
MSIEVSWTIKPCSPTHLITGYVVKGENRTSTSEANCHKTTCRLTNLKPYTEYNVSVKASTQVGYGVWSKTNKTKTTIAGMIFLLLTIFTSISKYPTNK